MVDTVISRWIHPLSAGIHPQPMNVGEFESCAVSGSRWGVECLLFRISHAVVLLCCFAAVA